MTDADPPYPGHWEAYVVLRDGGTAHIRPIVPADADRLRVFHSRLSAQTIYFRFFAPYPQLTDRDVERFTHVDSVDRAALVAEVGDQVIGVVRYERESPTVAEVAFVVEDAHQGRGLGSVLLEHIAAAARERGISRFVAEVLPTNRRMLSTFQEAGYQVTRAFEEGVVSLSFDLAPTETSLAVMRAREHRAEARSVQRLLQPSSVVVVGAGRSPHSVGRMVLHNLTGCGFTGSVSVVHPRAETVAGVPAYRSVSAVAEDRGGVDLVVVAVPAQAVDDVVADCARAGAQGLVVMSAGFAETGQEGREHQQRLVREARSGGMRVVGPSSFGLINADPAVRLNASLAPVVPRSGRVGFFAQSGALGIAVLDRAAQSGLGLSTFVSAGNRADVSGNDLLQYWEEDAATDVVLLYLESIGNPRKFSRLARRLSRAKPVVAVRSGRSTQAEPLGHVLRESRVPPEAVEALFAQAGVIRVDGIAGLFDVAQVLVHQPLPRGPRVAVVGNSHALQLLAADTCRETGLELAGEPILLPAQASAHDFSVALAAVFDAPDVDSVVAVFIPPVVTRDEDVVAVLAACARRGTKTVVSTFTGMRGVPTALPAGAVSDASATGEAATGAASRDKPSTDAASTGAPAVPAVPSYATVEDGVRALAAATRYARWRDRPAGEVPDVARIDADAARRAVEAQLAAAPPATSSPAGDGPGHGTTLPAAAAAALLSHYGIAVEPAVPVASAEEAVAAAERVGHPVVLKTTLPRLRHRTDLGGVRLGLGDADTVRAAYDAVTALHPDTADALVVQRMAPAGVGVVVTSVEDPLFGPVVSFGVAGVASDLLGDLAYGIPPLTDLDAADLVRGVRAAPLLLGWRGSPPADLAALEDLLLRVGRLADDLPEVAELVLDPVLAAPAGVTVLGAHVTLASAQLRADLGPRRLA